MTDGVKEFVSWMGIFGIPSLFAIISFLIKWFRKSYKKMEILAKAQQAQMRSQLLKDYYKYTERGFIYELELDDWLNQYKSYHALGENGCMDSKKDRIMQIPTRQDL